MWFGICSCCLYFFLFFFKQKTAYEMRISEWSSDVCSSDLMDAVATVLRANAGVAVDFVADHLHIAGAIDEHAEPGATHAVVADQIGRASCRERVCQYV